MANGDRIKGLTVKIGADTSDFVKELKKVDKEINATQKAGTNLQKGLEIQYDETRFVQAQKKVQQALKETEEKASAIRKQLAVLEESGQIDTQGYEILQDQLAQTETKALQLTQQLEQIDKIKFDAVTKGLTEASDKLDQASKKTKALSAVAAGALAGMTALAKGAVSTGDDIQTTADQYNVTAEAIERLNYIALQSDVPAEQLYKGMTKARDAIGTALAGETNSATKALQSLVGDISKIPTDTEGAFFGVVNALADVKDSTLQAYYANEIFGERMATEIIPLLKQGSQGIRELSKEFETSGYLTNEQIASLAEYDNKLNQVNTQLANAKTELGLALLPVLDTLTQLLKNNLIPLMQQIADWFGNLSEGGQKFVIVGLAITAMLSPVLKLMSSLLTVVPKLVSWVKTLTQETLKSQLGFLSLAGAMGFAIDLIANWKNMSTVEKILKTLAVAALTAAGAITVFHASWSLGLAIGAITAGVVAGIAAIKSAGEDIGVESKELDNMSSSYSNRDYTVPSSLSSGGGDVYNEDNSQYSIQVNLNASGDLNYDSKALAEEVIKQIQIKRQAGL